MKKYFLAFHSDTPHPMSDSIEGWCIVGWGLSNSSWCNPVYSCLFDDVATAYASYRHDNCYHIVDVEFPDDWEGPV